MTGIYFLQRSKVASFVVTFVLFTRCKPLNPPVWMEGVSSSPGGNNDLVLKKVVDELYFLPRNLNIFFEQYAKKQAKPPRGDSSVETVLFPIIIEQILLYQTSPGKLYVHPSFESRVFQAITQQISPFILQASPFADRFRYIEDLVENHIQAEIQKMETEFKQYAKILVFDTGSSTQTPVSLQATMNMFFDVVSGFEKLDIDVVEQLLEGLIDLVTSDDCPSVLGVSPALISKFNMFLVDLALSSKFATNKIKSKVITFLLHIARIQGGISTVLAALMVGMTAEASTPFDGIAPKQVISFAPREEAVEFGSLFGSKWIVKNINSNIYSCAASSNFLWLVVDSGLYQILRGDIVMHMGLDNPARTLVTCNEAEIRLFDIDTSTVKRYSVVDDVMELGAVSLSHEIPPGSNVIGIAEISDCTLLFVVREVAFQEYAISAFDIERKVPRTVFTERVKTSFSPKFVLPSKSTIHLLAPGNDTVLRCSVAKNDTISDFCFKSVEYAHARVLHHEGGVVTSSGYLSYVFVRRGTDIEIYQYNVKYGDLLPFPEFAKPKADENFETFNGFVVKTISDMTIPLYKTVHYVFQKLTPHMQQSLQAFASSPKETIKFALSLGNQALTSELAPPETRQRMLFFSLMLLTINGRCYVAQFPLNSFSFDDVDLEIQKGIRTFLEQTAFHPLATPEIVAAVFQAVKATFHVIYYPNYGDFRTFLDEFAHKPKLLAVALPFLRGSSPLFYALDHQILCLVKPYLTHQNICYIMHERIRCINAEMHFLMKHNIASSHEPYVAKFVSALFDYYTDSLCIPELFTKMQYSAGMIARIFAQVLVLDSAPIVSVYFAQSCLRLLRKVQEVVKPSAADMQADLELSSISDANETTQKRVKTFETKHPYEDGEDIEMKIEMPGATEIDIEFDSRCATEENTDYLQIYDRSEGGSLVGRNLSGRSDHINWPTKITVPSDSCRLFFHADESTNDWGVKLTISAHVPVTTRQFKPDICLSMMNLLCYAIGRSLQQALISIPVSEIEEENKIILDSGILQGAYHVFRSDQMKQAVSQVDAIVDSHKPVTGKPIFGNPKPNRSLSERLFEECVVKESFNASKQCDDAKQTSLLADLTAEFLPENSAAALLMKSLYESLHKQLIKMMPLSSVVERFACAAFIKMLGLLSLSWSIGKELVQYTANPSGRAKPPIPYPLERIVKAVYGIRTSLYFAFQKSNLPNHNPNLLRENYQEFARQMLLKAKFLLLTDTVLHDKDEAMDETKLDKSIAVLVSFLSSEVRFADLAQMVTLRENRAKTRIRAMDIACEFMDVQDLFDTAKISFLAPLVNAFPVVVDKGSIQSISSQLMETYDAKCSEIHSRFVHIIAERDVPNALRLLLLRTLLFPTRSIGNDQKNVESLLGFLSTFSPQTIDELAFSEGLWLFVTNVAVQNRTPDMCNFLHGLLQRPDRQEALLFKIVSLQSVLVLDSYYQDIDLQFCFDMLKDGTPRIFVAVFQFLAGYFSTYGIPARFEIVFDSEKCDLERFIEKVLTFIAMIKIYDPIPVLRKGMPFASHQMLADEFISFLRVLITPTSKASQVVHSILEHVLGRITHTRTLENLMSDRKLALHFLALLLVFGEGAQPAFENGHAIVTSGCHKDEFIKITTYSSLSDAVSGYSLAKSEPVSVALSSITPTARFPSNLRNFNFGEDAIAFFEQFHLACQKIISVNRVHEDHVLLFSVINAFYCFIPLLIQNPAVMVNFLKCCNISSWLDLSVMKTRERRLHSVSEIVADITDIMEDLSTEHAKEQMIQIKEWVKNEEQLGDKQPRVKYGFDSPQNAVRPESHLLFSLLSFEERLFSPDRMTVLHGYGEVKGSVGKTSLSATFVGNRNVPSGQQFYWEAKITTASGKPRFKIGFMDYRAGDKTHEMFSLSYPELDISSPAIGSVALPEHYVFESGDILGVALARNQVTFFANGVQFGRSIPSPHLGDFTPFISFTSTEASFQYNFGDTQFKTDIIEETIFDTYQQCSVEVDAKIEQECATFRSDSYEDPSFLEVLKTGRVTRKGPKKNPLSKETCYPKRADHQPTGTQIPFVMENPKPQSDVRVSIGSPCKVIRTHLPPKEILPNESIVFSIAMKRKLGRIGIVKELIPRKDGCIAVLDFCNPAIGSVETLKFDGRFLSSVPMRRNSGTEFGHEQVIEPEYLHKQVASFMKSENVLSTKITEALCLTRGLSIRMARYTLLVVMDYLRSQKTGLELFRNEKIVSLLSILILELTSFSPSVRINAKWSQNVATDAVFVGTTSNTMFVTDSSKMLKKLRSVLYSLYQCEEESDLFSALFDDALKTLCSNSDQPDNLMKLAPPHLRFESTCPCPKIQFNYTVKEPSAVGFVPVIASTCDIPGPGINAANIFITGRQDELRFIAGEKFDIRGQIVRCSFGGLAMAFFPIARRLCDGALPQPAGAVHLIFSLLSLVFSYNLSTVNKVLCHRMKSQLFPAFLKILKDGGVFGTIFAFEFVAPLLSHLEWRSGDLTSSTLSLIREYLKRFEDSVTEWKLSVAAQHATLLNMLFDLTVIDATTRNIIKPPGVQDITISDGSVESAKYGHMLSFFYQTLNQKLHQKPSCVFHEVTDVFTKVAALAHNWNFPIKFPSFLLLDSFLSSVQHDPVVINSYENFEFTETEAIRNVSIPYAKTLSITVEGCPRVDVINQENERNTYVVTPGNKTRVYTNSIQIRIPKDLEKFEITIHLVDLTPLGRENLFITHIDEFSAHCQFMANKWNQKIDETLLKIMNQNPELSSDKGTFTLSHTQLASNSVLQDVPPSLLAARVELIKQLNSPVTLLLKCVDLGDNQVLSAAVIAAKSAINTSYKLDLFRKCVMTHLEDDQRLNLSFNRSRAALHMTNPSHPDAMPLIRQLIDQVPIRSLKALKRDSVPWHVDLLGEGATDAGGPARDLFTQMCLEVMHPSTGLFVMTPNKRAARGPNQELLIPNSYSTAPQHKSMFVYTGVLMTIAFISRLPQPFKFVEFVWGHFTGAQMTIQDIYSIDSEFELLMRQVDSGEIDDVEAERRGLTFTVRDSHGEVVELFPGGGTVRVTKARMSEYSQMCKKLRLREMKQQLDWLKEGISYFFPPEALFLLSPWELELIVCGDNSVPVSELKKHCKYDAKDKSSKMLWQVLEKFSPEERMLFIKFATGRMGLPPPGSRWHSLLTITWVTSNVKDDAAMPLPTAATCSSTIRIPRYTTKAWMAKKIRAAIVFGVDIDTDRQVNFADIVPLT